MNYKKLIFIFLIIMFLPAVILLLVGMVLVPMIVFLGVSKGHWETMILLLPLLGGGVGLLTAALIIFDIAGNSLLPVSLTLKRFGLLLGILSKLSVVAWIAPNMEPFLYYWLPPLVGGVVLFVLSYQHKFAN